MTIDDFKAQQRKQVNSPVGLVTALLSLSVIVALLGIVNTLALSVHERTRELGLLRAVGMSRRQVRRMVRAESVITAAIGAGLGIVLGVALAAIVSRPQPPISNRWARRRSSSTWCASSTRAWPSPAPSRRRRR